MPEVTSSDCPYQNLFIYYLRGCVTDDPVMADVSFIGNWEEEGDTFLFFNQAAQTLVHQMLKRQPHLEFVDHFEMTYEQWHGGKLYPYRVGRLLIVPPWHQQHVAPDFNTIILDPGVVFGTGAHPTTHHCLSAIQLAFSQSTIQHVLDIGTGSGLLSLAAAAMGACQVIAVDLNALSAITALRNVRTNQMQKQVLVVQGDAKNFMDLPCDLMISNIHYEVMRHLVVAPGFRAQKQFILSGLLRSQARDIEYQLLSGEAKIRQKWDHDGIWYTFYGTHS